MRGRGFTPNPRIPFGQSQRPLFNRMQFNRNQRPTFPQNQPLPFNPTQQPPFGQNPLQFVGGPLRGNGGGGGGNLIVINTLPEGGEQPPGPRFPGQRLPFLGWFGGPMNAGRGGGPLNAGRGGGPMNAGRGGGPMNAVRGGGLKMGAGIDGLPPMESSPKPMLLRPQDKYCPSSDPAAAVQETAPLHRKKKGEFAWLMAVLGRGRVGGQLICKKSM